MDERFTGPDLDPSRWMASYLPAWSSREASAATYNVGHDGLRLSIPSRHPLWCPDLHEEPLRVSAVQSGNWSGPVGSLHGQQPFRDGLVVREQQPSLHGFVPHHGRIEVECSAHIGPGSMFSAWMVGMEDKPERCGEICLVEVFGSTIDGGTVEVGRGVHSFRDSALVEEFAAPRLEIDVAEPHVYAVEWRPDGIDWFIDHDHVASSTQSPAYPMMLILAVFDFPSAEPHAGPDFVPELVVRRVTGPSPHDEDRRPSSGQR